MISNEVKQEIIRCQALDKPAYGLKSEIRNFVGKIVRFTCAPGYRLYGHETRQCKETGLWSWGEAPVCKSKFHVNFLTFFDAMLSIPILLGGRGLIVNSGMMDCRSLRSNLAFLIGFLGFPRHPRSYTRDARHHARYLDPYRSLDLLLLLVL